MSYTVLARKYRPQTFSELVGQEHVARTLGNAIESGRVAHAFLFTGVRGIGKTTTARVLAKALNCVKGPVREPCNQCDPCREITAGVDMDVQEIDGASNNGVEDVRRLQESLPYRPARDRFKVVIVDEVHMLSAGAFNAFLKTLEEPPPHVKFIFATTEYHKIPLTIRSRCQRYDFRLIPRAEISDRVRQILKAEKIEADDAVISIVSRQAGGSMRDALTLLDQVVALGGERIEEAEVARWLGIADRSAVFDAAKALVDGDAAAGLRLVSQVAEQGLDLPHFLRQLLELLRDLVVLRVAGFDSELVELTDDERRSARAIAEAHDVLHLERAFAGVARLVDEVARSAVPRLVMEMGLVRLADRPPLRPIGELLAELQALESRVTGAGGSPRAVVESPSRPAAAPAPARKAKSEPPAEPSNSGAPEPRSSRATSSDGTAAGGAGDEAPNQWSEVVALLRETQPALSAVLEHGVPIEATAQKLKLAFREGSFFGRQAIEPAAQEAITAAAQQVFGERPSLQIVYCSEPESMGTSVNQAQSARAEEQRKTYQERALNHPRVKEALEIFPEAKDHVEVRVDVPNDPK